MFVLSNSFFFGLFLYSTNALDSALRRAQIVDGDVLAVFCIFLPQQPMDRQ
jgi:hypothetical protein